MEVIEVELLNWNKFQEKRKDVKHASWLRLDHDIFDHEDFWGFTREEFCFFVYLLCQASKQNSGYVRVNVEKAIILGRFKKRVIHSALKKLEQIETLRIIETASVTDQSRERNADGTLHDKTDKTDRHDTTDTAELASASHAAPIIPEFLDSLTHSLLEKTSLQIQQTWLNTYKEPEWLKEEFRKAVAWIHANPKKAPKSDFARFLNNWLSRGWERHRKGVPSSVKTGADIWLEQKLREQETSA